MSDNRIKHGLDPQTGTPKAMRREYVMSKPYYECQFTFDLDGQSAKMVEKKYKEIKETYVIVATTQTPWNRIVDALASWVDNDELPFTADDAERFLDGVES